MSNSFEFDHRQLDKFEKKLLRVTKEVKPKHYRKALRQTGNLLRKAVRANTPKVSGALRRSYRVKGPRKDEEIIVGTEKYYAKMVEEGHVIKRKRKGRNLGHVKGKWYFKKSLEETKKELPGVLKEAIRDMGKELGFRV